MNNGEPSHGGIQSVVSRCGNIDDHNKMAADTYSKNPSPDKISYTSSKCGQRAHRDFRDRHQLGELTA